MRTQLLVATTMIGTLIGGSAAWAAPVLHDQGQHTASGGMGTPEAAVDELLASVRASDPLGLLAVFHPEERHLVDTLYTNSTGSAAAAGTVNIDALLQAMYIDVTTQPLVVEPLSDRVAWVTTTNAQVTAMLDVTQLDAAVTADLSSWEPVDPYRSDFEPQVDDLGVAVVNEGGQWFVSALYTVAEIARRSMDLPPQLAVSAPPTSGATTPEAAVAALTTALSAKNLAAAASALTPFEGRLVADYSASIGAELLDALRDYTVAVEPLHIQVVDQSTDWAIVEVDAWRFAVSGVDEDGDRVDTTLTVEGVCGETHDWDHWDEAYNDSKGCAFEEDSGFNVFKLLADAGWRGPRFVAVNQGGTWSVSLLQTVLQATAPFTTDVVTFAGVVEFAAMIMDVDQDSFYPNAISFLAAGQAPVTVGTATVPARGNGSIAIFRVDAGSTVRVDVAPGEYDECFVAVLDEALDDFAATFECGEQSEPIDSASTLLVTTSNAMAFSSIYPLGTVTVTVS